MKMFIGFTREDVISRNIVFSVTSEQFENNNIELVEVPPVALHNFCSFTLYF